MSKLKDKVSITFILSSLLVSAAITGITFGPLETARAQTPPENLNGHSWNQTQINLTWNEPTGGSHQATLDSYNIYRGLGAEQPSYHDTVDPSVVTYTDGDVIEGRTYSYYITAEYVDKGESGPTDTISVTVGGSSPPTAPQNLQAHPGDEEVQLTWDEPSDDGGSQIEGYNISRGTIEDSLSFYNSVSGPGYTDQDVQNGVTYHYKVKAINDVGESESSNLASAKPVGDIVIPSYPENLKAYSGDGKVELYWEPPSNLAKENIIEYNVYRGRGWQGDAAPYATTKDASYIDQQVNNGDEYYYTVTAVSTKGEGLRSNEAKGEPSDTGIPGSPTSLKADGGEGEIEVSWKPPQDSDVTGYALFRGSGSTENISFLTEIGNDSETEYKDTVIEEDITYYYEVKALNEEMIGESSGIDDASLQEKEGGTDESLPWTIIVLALLVLVALFGIALWKKQKERGPPRGEDHEWKHHEEEEETEGKDEEAEPSTPGDQLASGQGGSTEEISEDGEIEITGEDDWG